MTVEPKISIIVPVFNVQEHIERCVRSLFEQSLSELEYIFVDDCSTDGSKETLLSVLAEYPHRQNQVTVLSNSRRRGPLQSRSRGDLLAKGRYLMHADADDYLELDAAERLFRQATDEHSDAVVISYAREFTDRTEVCIRQWQYVNGKDFIRHIPETGFEFFLWGVFLRNTDELKQIIMRYYNHSEWEGFYMWEDMLIALPVLYNCKRISYNPAVLYHYNRTNVSSTLNTQKADNAYAALRVVDTMKGQLPEQELNLTWQMLTFAAKTPLITSVGLKQWKAEHSECNRYLMQMRHIPLKLRIWYWLLLHVLDDKSMQKIYLIKKRLLS